MGPLLDTGFENVMLNRPGFHAPSGFCEPAGWLASQLIVVVGFGFGRWDASEAVHQALLVVPGDLVGGDELDVAEVAQRAAAER